VHVLSQFLWPDDAPTGIYSENLADALDAAGTPVVLVGGRGRYRAGGRPAPRTPIRLVRHFEGTRSSLLSTAREYLSVRRAFEAYVREFVERGDVVVVTSAPPTTLSLHRAIRRKGGTGIYWLQDYYPQLVRGIWDPPAGILSLLSRYWDRELRAWHHVVKVASNLAFDGPNVAVVRNWPTLDLGEPHPAKPGTALYSGNLGWPHHLPSFLALCEEMRSHGYSITVRGDGKGMSSLPGWIQALPPIADVEVLRRSYWEAEVHLVAGHPDFPGAVFPSKFWNALATGRRVLVSGFSGPMLDELRIARESDWKEHLPRLRDIVARALGCGR
jgi:hypothetical protein